MVELIDSHEATLVASGLVNLDPLNHAALETKIAHFDLLRLGVCGKLNASVG